LTENKRKRTMAEFKDIRKEARRQGWREQPTKKGINFIPPDPAKPIVNWHGTPSDWRAVRNLLAQMKGSGFMWPPPRRKK
jgi:hypothetical protein